MEQIFETDWARGDYYPESKLVIITWKDKDRVLTFDEYKHPFEKSLELQVEKKFDVRFFISDTRNQGAISPKYRKWFQNEAAPRAQKQGLEKAAVVMDANVFKRYYINHIMKTLNTLGLPFKAFKDLDAAKQWLVG
jgi:hypothetical protein